MRWTTLAPTGVSQTDTPVALPGEGWLWFDALHEEVDLDRGGFADAVEQLTGRRLFELHIADAVNLQHPSYFDSTEHYDMLVFRKLATGEKPPLMAQDNLDSARSLTEIETRPITFFVFERVLVTVRDRGSKTIEQAQARLLETRIRSHEERIRLPTQPFEFMLRLLNGMVDRYLELRQPLTERLDRWQRALLDPRRSFADWSALLEARIELRKLENLSEGQYDALQEMRDEYLQSTPESRQSDAFLVRLNDVMEHVQRVLSHARRLEVSAESAVQLHFSATAHRTNQVIRTLTVITAIFAPLTLITGIFGMNFQYIPMLGVHDGFYYVLAAMLGLSVLLLIFFWARRVISDRPARLRLRLLRWLRQRPHSR